MTGSKNWRINQAGQARRQAILGYLSTCIAAGNSPSYREIGEAVGIYSSATVNWHIKKLIAAGHLRQKPGQHRAIELATPPASLESRLLAMVEQALEDVHSAGTETDALEMAEASLRQLAEFLRGLQ